MERQIQKVPRAVPSSTKKKKTTTDASGSRKRTAETKAPLSVAATGDTPICKKRVKKRARKSM